LAELQEWSYGFKVLESEEGEFEGRQVRFLKKMQVFEVSPVMQGAGVETMTVAIKGEKVWEDMENEIRHRLRDPSDFEEDSFRRITLKRDKPRVFAVAGRLKGETTMTVQSVRFPKDDGWTMAEAKKWMADHPDLGKQADIDIITFADDVQAMTERTKLFIAQLTEEGHDLTAAKRERLSEFSDVLAQCAKQIGDALDSVQPEDGIALFLKVERDRSRRLGVAV
jgi:hypothetical protein